MSEVKFQGHSGYDGSSSGIHYEYFLVMRDDGHMHCSCGRLLVKLEDHTYKCGGGYPIYRPSDGEVQIDKFGNLMIKVKPHPSDS